MSENSNSRQMGREIGQVFTGLALILICVAMLAPLVWLVRQAWAWALG